MAGNTKLIGFKANHAVVLERWGKQAEVVLDWKTCEVLAEACATLPKKPPERSTRPFYLKFDPHLHQIMFNFGEQEATLLSSVLEHVCGETDSDVLDDILAALKDAVEAMKSYYSTNDEPGGRK